MRTIEARSSSVIEHVVDVVLVSHVGVRPQGRRQVERHERNEEPAGVGPPAVAVPREPSAAAVTAGAATQSLLLTRACYLALRRAVHLPLRPSGVVLVT